MLTIDGSFGEGGGQILRTALSLSMITGTPFRIEKVRAGRKKPGLLRQHLMCVNASAQISNAKLRGAELGSTAFSFEPGTIRGGEYDFAIGSAGSTALVFQTVLPALLRADAPSHVKFSGGTHNPSAPTFDYLDRVFLPLLARMGATVEPKLLKSGYYPAGGGSWHARISPPGKLTPLILEDAGPVQARRIFADVANLAIDIAGREASTVAHMLSWPPETMLCRTINADGHGNVLAVQIDYENLTEMFTSFGARDISAEAVARNAVEDVRDYLVAGAPVGPHLADQLLLPCALAGAGTYITNAATEHTTTNIATIEKFLPVEFNLTQLDQHRWRVTVES
jgi:RNA 3'-terminal phosphate cyclase (ATP)